MSTRLPAALALAGSDATDVDCDPGANPFDLAPFMGFESADSMDPVLEIWVDGDRPVVTIRLVGILDRTTRDRLLSVMDELVTEGIESFVMDMGEAEIFGASGAAALALLQRLVREAGRTLLWEGVDFDKPTWGAPP